MLEPLRRPSPLVLALSGIALAVSACGDGDRDDTPPGEDASLTSEMESIEETTESFANALLDLSIATRRRDQAEIARFFASSVQSNGRPTPSGDPVAVSWVSQQDFAVGESVVEHGREEFVAELNALVDRFRSVEDARFKVAQSTVAGNTVAGKLKLWIVGRNQDGQREWLRGKAKAAASRDGEQWRLDRFVFTELGAMTASRDLFDEVAEPAGLGAAAPPAGARSDESFAAYGAAAADVDRDGLIDLFVTGAAAHHLYLNQGDGTFTDVAAAALLRELPHTATAPLFLDFDGDGDRDLFLSAIGDQFLFENRHIPDGKVEFWDVSARAGVARHAIGFSAVAGDINGDALPDIYVASYNRYGDVLPDNWDGASNGTANLLLVSRGDGTYEEQARARGVADQRWSYAAGFADVDADGRLDLYVANDFGGGNALFMNQGDQFVDEAEQRGVTDGGYGMGVSFADYDNDGHLDLHVTRMSSTAGRRILARLGGGRLPARERLESMAIGNALYRNLGDGTFRDVSAEAGPFSGGWAWGGGFFDLDNDGREDLYTPNGFVSGSSLKDT